LAWSWSSRTNTGTPQPLASRYRYDVLNRIRVDTLSTRASTAWQATPNYRSSYTYDGNGNLKNLVRVDSAGTLMDSLVYRYQVNRNRLTHVDDPGGVAGNHIFDVDDQQADNYTYDATGNLTSDVQEGITSIEWTPSNKIRSITKGSTSKLEYTYDGAGNRVVKRYYQPASKLKHTTWYARDAQGNVLSIYERATPTSEVKQTEVHIYGSSRIGIEQRNSTYSTSPFAWLESEQHRDAGKKRYELTDHLGNVRVTISDLLVPRPASSFGYVTQDAEVLDRRDYYPFGMEMPGRRWRATGEDAARFGFNGKENDNEVKGEGSQQDYGFRIYDPRVARFLSVDPLSSKFPWNSTYAFAENDVVRAIDLEGLERLIVITRLWEQKVRLMPAKEISSADQARMQANFFLRHPSAALEIGWFQRGSTNISSIAGRMARHMAVDENMTSEEGSESNGFRHVLWQAMITAQYGRAIADEAGRAHEGIGYWEQTDIDWQAAPIQRIEALDQLVDVLNNEIGRRIGEKHPEASNKQLALLVLDEQKNKGVWLVEEGRDGALRVAKRTISDQQYQTARKELDRLDDTGMSAEERAAVAND